ncbi:MAG TPA: DUF1318 domain-containing protein [Candidatus Binatia bacterium]|jgi:uncharacterized protein YdbL (DUF1318 family)|nr:DUF1318 domain-containing protein [Candidatus Binatia bacterium]
MKCVQFLVVVALVASAATAGCLRTKSDVEVKPVDINLNISGRLELVITDARRQEEQITGAKPKRTVRPEDIGLPPVVAPRSEAAGPGAKLTTDDPAFQVVLAASAYAADAGGDRQAQLIQQMAARHPQIEALLDSQLVGESHTGFLVPRASLSASQQALVGAENADRAELYRLEAAKKNTTIDQVTIGYYLARLEHVNRGTWVERYNKSTGTWEWFRWDR